MATINPALEAAAPSLEGFKAFVLEQEHSRKINHLMGWENCAIGDYVASLGGERDLPVSHRFVSSMEGRGLHSMLSYPHLCEEIAPTYGHLAAIIEKGLPYPN